MSADKHTPGPRDILAARIRAARAVSIKNDPQRFYRKSANAARLDKSSNLYSRHFGIGKITKATGSAS